MDIEETKGAEMRSWANVIRKSRVKGERKIRLPTFEIFAMTEGFSEKETKKFIEEQFKKGNIIMPMKKYIEFI